MFPKHKRRAGLPNTVFNERAKTTCREKLLKCLSAFLSCLNHKSKITNGNNSSTNNSKSKAVFPLADVAPLAVLLDVVFFRDMSDDPLASTRFL